MNFEKISSPNQEEIEIESDGSEEGDPSQEAKKLIKEVVKPDEVKVIIDEDQHEKAEKVLTRLMRRAAEASPRARKAILVAIFSGLVLFGGTEKSAAADEPLDNSKKESKLEKDYKTFDQKTQAVLSEFNSELTAAVNKLGLGDEIDIQILVERGGFGPQATVVLAGETEVVKLFGIGPRSKDIAVRRALEGGILKPEWRSERAKSVEIGKFEITGIGEDAFNNLGTLELLKVFAEKNGLKGKLDISAKAGRGGFGPECEIVITDENGQQVKFKVMDSRGGDSRMRNAVEKYLLSELGGEK